MSAPVAAVAGAASVVAVTSKVTLSFRRTGVLLKVTWYLQSSPSPSPLYSTGASGSAVPGSAPVAPTGWHDAWLTTIGVTPPQCASARPLTGPPTGPSLLEPQPAAGRARPASGVERARNERRRVGVRAS